MGEGRDHLARVIFAQSLQRARYTLLDFDERFAAREAHPRRVAMHLLP